MNEIQTQLLAMLKWFHTFCAEHGIEYFAIGGTFLGAVRHHGFIPWDDDVDVGVPRQDYERLKALMKELPRDGRYLFEAPGENKDFDYLFCKLYDTETTLVEHTRARTKRGLYLDIFPLDGIGDTREESLKNDRKIVTSIRFYLTRTCALRKGRKFYKNVAIVLGRCIPGFLYRKRKKAAQIDRLCAAHPYHTSRYVGNLLGITAGREIMERAIFGEPRLYPFEGIQIYGPCEAERYLTTIYGDYKKLPPEEKRVSHHDWLVLDLKRPYRD